MKIRELMDKLGEFNPDDNVFVTDSGGWLHGFFIGDEEYEPHHYLTISSFPEKVGQWEIEG